MDALRLDDGTLLVGGDGERAPPFFLFFVEHLSLLILFLLLS